MIKCWKSHPGIWIFPKSKRQKMDIFIFIHILPPSFNIMIPGEPFSLRTNPPGGQKMAKKESCEKLQI